MMKGTKHITVRSREQAWIEAGRIFPTDYEQDPRSSANAGYPIYQSTSPDNWSWISDLNTRIELSIQKGKAIETVIIDIKEEETMTATIELKNIKTINFTDGILTIIFKTENGEVKVSQYSKESLGDGQLNIF